MAHRKLTALLLLVGILATVYSQNLTYVKTLYKDLFSDYTQAILPMADHSKPLNIGINFYLASLNYFKEVEEMVSILGVFSLNWTDPSLTWNPASYGYLYNTVIDPKDMWLPSLFLINRVDTMKPIGHEITFLTLLIYNGMVYYTPGGILQAKCPTDISKFPFDTQECILEILPWGVGTTHLTLTSLSDKAHLDWFTPNSDWTLTEYSTSVGIRSGYNLFFFKMRIKREPLYYTVVIILPTLLFAVLNPLVFVLPVASGERVSLAMTILLAYAIFLTLVSASIPTSSNPMCFLLVIMIVIIAISGIITCGAIISAKYYYIEDIDDVWSLLVRFTRWRVKRKKNSVFPVNDKQEITVIGKDVAHAVDFLFFYGSTIALMICAISYFVSVFV